MGYLTDVQYGQGQIGSVEDVYNNLENSTSSSEEDQNRVLDYILVLDWMVPIFRSVTSKITFAYTIHSKLISLVYGTTWVGETYYREDASRAEELRKSTDVVGDIARRGSLALVLFSFISFTGSILLPWVVESPTDDDDDDTSTSSKRLPRGVAKTVGLLQRYRPDITTAWGLSQMGFGLTMILAPLARSFEFATTLIALCG
ncbi:MAG: hypothetical protein Q9187_007192, partial [Circinaria calcarea]